MFSKISLSWLHHQLYQLLLCDYYPLDIQGAVKHSLRGTCISNYDGDGLEEGRCMTNKVHWSDIGSQFKNTYSSLGQKSLSIMLISHHKTKVNFFNMHAYDSVLILCSQTKINQQTSNSLTVCKD